MHRVAVGLLVLGAWRAAHADPPREEVLAALDEAVERDPTDVAPLLQRASVLAELRRYDQALASLDRAASISPDDARLAPLRAKLELSRGRAADARAELDAHVRRLPDDRGALLLHAAACEALDDVDEAIDDLSSALALRYDDDLALRIARLLRAVGKRDAAARLLLGAAAREPAHPAILIEAIAVLRRQRDFDGALRLVDRLARGAAVPTHMELLRGEILAQAGRPAQSREAFRRALVLANQTLRLRASAAALVERGRARLGLADFEGAHIDFDAARSLAPRLPELGQLLEAAQQRRSAP
jgi:tetratricopeptide (TPR) repeat protein